MFTISIYLDKRGTHGLAPLKISISKHSSSAYISTGVKILPSQWDKKAMKIKDHPDKNYLNTFIAFRKTEVQRIAMSLSIEGRLRSLSATQIKNLVLNEIEPEDNKTLFYGYFESFASSRNSSRTKEIYLLTLKRISWFDKNATNLHFEEINKKWLDRYEQYFKDLGQSESTINIDLRNIRAVINDAIDNDIITSYVFRKKKIKSVQTRKRSLSVERLRELWNYPVEPWQQRYLDIFKLTFYLIGINLADLTCLRSIDDGRITYKRKKTGRIYNIKVEPEALEIINRYKGREYLLNIAETFKTYKSFTCKCNRGLQSIGKASMIANEEYTIGSQKHKYHILREPSFPGLSLYWARHSWATLASELEIPKETISAALGHSTSNVTDIYIKFNYKKVDEANRRVIDYLLNK